MEYKISWTALEYKRKEKTADWYWAVIIIALSMAITSFFLHNVLFGILIIISVITLLLFSVTEPKILQIHMDQKGITVEKERYPFASIEAFWVDNSEEHNQKILLKSKKVIMPLIVVPLEEHNHLDIRDFLLEYLEEREMHEPIPQKIMEKLGF